MAAIQSVSAMMAHAFSWVVSQRSALRAPISQRTVLGARLFPGSSLASVSSTMDVVRVSVFMFQ